MVRGLCGNGTPSAMSFVGLIHFTRQREHKTAVKGSVADTNYGEVECIDVHKTKMGMGKLFTTRCK